MRHAPLILAFALLSVLAVSPTRVPGASHAPVPAVALAGVTGQGWDALACAGCFASAFMVLTSPPAVILAAIAAKGSAIVAAGCAYSCWSAIS